MHVIHLSESLTFIACANIGLARKNATSACMWLSWSIEWIEGSRSTYSSTVMVDPRNVPNCTKVSWHWSYNLPIIKNKNGLSKNSDIVENFQLKILILSLHTIHISTSFCIQLTYQQVSSEIYLFPYKQRNVFVVPSTNIKRPQDRVLQELPLNAVKISLCCELDWSNRPCNF
jgi:hypothetical protein